MIDLRYVWVKPGLRGKGCVCVCVCVCGGGGGGEGWDATW